jgi:hypothetical protein
MSTRAMYTFKDEHGTVHVYKHHDGYPEGAIEFIANSIPFAWELPRFEADDFAAAFVAGNKQKSGGGIRLCGTGIKHPYDFSSDSEYWYEVTFSDNALRVTIYDVSWWQDEKKSTKIFSGTLAEALAKYVTV